MSKHKHITEKQYRKDIRKYEFFRRLLGGALCRAFGLEPIEKKPLEGGPCLIMANHTTDADIFFMGLSFQHMYYVASSHILSWGLISSFISWALHPISRLKGTTDALTVLEIRRRLKLGANVCIFPEGGRSPSGVTEKPHPTTVKLIRSCRCGLVTCRIKGGFFTQPHFAPDFRRGKMTGELVHIYSKEDIAAMSEEELYSALFSDLYEDACETQKVRRARFKCKKPGRYLENSLYACPACGKLCGLTSDDGGIFCSCGFRADYDEYGDFHGTELSFTQWYEYQNGRLSELCASGGFTLSDSGLDIREIDLTRRRLKRAYTRLELREDGFTLSGGKGGEKELFVPIGKTAGMTCYGSNHLLLPCDGRVFVISGDKRFNALKYINAHEILSKGKTDEPNAQTVVRGENA